MKLVDQMKFTLLPFFKKIDAADAAPGDIIRHHGSGGVGLIIAVKKGHSGHIRLTYITGTCYIASRAYFEGDIMYILDTLEGEPMKSVE